MKVMIQVFRTTVDTTAKIVLLKPHLDRITTIRKWNFDLWDCDRILRIDGQEDTAEAVTAVLARHGFACTELE